MNDDLEKVLAALRREYIADGPARLAELRKDLAAFMAGEPDAAESLKSRFHRLAGSGGSYGFEEISVISREVEQWLKQTAAVAPTAENTGRLSRAVERLSAAFDTAALQVTLPEDGPQHGEFGWRARLIGPPGALLRQMEQLLTLAGYHVISAAGNERARCHPAERASRSADPAGRPRQAPTRTRPPPPGLPRGRLGPGPSS